MTVVEVVVGMSCRILYVVGQLGLGGLEHQLYYLLKSMDRKQYQPELVVWNDRDEDSLVQRIRALGVVLHVFSEHLSAVQKIRALRQLVRRIRPEVVHSYTFYTNFAVFSAILGTQAVAVGSVRSDFDWIKRETGPCLGRLSARWPRIQIFNSLAAARTAHSVISPFVPAQCLVVRNRVDLGRFRAMPLPSGEKVQIVGIGSLLPVKRWDRVLVAALSLKGQGFNILIRVAGGGPLLMELKQRALTFGVDDSVEFLGSVENVQKLLAEADFLVHPSDNEGCPNAIMEAMACGRAVVATAVGDIPNIVEDGKTGFVVSREDNQAFIERMARLISDRHLCSLMGQAGRGKAEREFRLDQLVSETLAAYRVAGWRDSQRRGDPTDARVVDEQKTCHSRVLN